MLTLFTTAKPFTGHSALIQRNALQSWKLLDPDVEVILFGDDEGAAEVARELGIRHEPHVERNEFGTKRLDYLFSQAQAIARHETLCYVNCDILLMEDFREAAKRVSSERREFLMVGRRWDADITAPIDFAAQDWAERTQNMARTSGTQRNEWWIDYFVFSLGVYGKEIPPLVIGRVHWDNWLIWQAGKNGAAVVDASETVCAVHQNHGYGYHPQGKEGVWTDEQARRNLQLAGGYRHLRTIGSAKYRLTRDGIRPNRLHWVPHSRNTISRYAERARSFLQTAVWHPLLGVTRPIRHALGLKRASVDPRKPR